MGKWIKYHFLFLMDKKWWLMVFVIALCLTLILGYFGSLYEPITERLLNYQEYSESYEKEAFIVINLLLSLWVFISSKELLCFEEPHVVTISKKKYLISKIISYLIFYLCITFLFYGIYQIIKCVSFGVNPFNYHFMLHLVLNVSIVHGITVLALGKSKSILVSILFTLLIVLLDRLTMFDNLLTKYITFFYPILDLNHPVYGYIHVLLMIVLIYFLAITKHLKSFS